jgi:hypothetical protein
MIRRLFAFLAVALVIGAPLVAYIWDSLNRIVAGDVRRLVVALPLLVAFATLGTSPSQRR